MRRSGGQSKGTDVAASILRNDDRRLRKNRRIKRQKRRDGK